ncbi:hypothetical protein M407DRAFT_81963 [Tulasnella calospora MUT 4182]|uniref:Helicase ATP-binding domain-containing protein n=1 Tax=Tulasnella calospora MUT 4182 TaxID=1051891 RepID=A0A0C3Q8J2_9AGAM|nr:hypothetical protein M407DRAFT_81963 [Tulasnella calospora MUT 4182]
MGLGKTIQVLARICDAKFVQKEKGPTCIVAPAGILSHWESETKKFAPVLKVLVHQRTRIQDPRLFEGYDVVLVSYETLRSEWKNWKNRGTKNTAMFRAFFLRIVLDEGHMIANPETQQSKACRDLDGKYRWLASGTAINRNVAQMESFLTFLRVNPESLPRSSSDRTKVNQMRFESLFLRLTVFLSQAFETLLEMRNEKLPHRGGSLDSLARPMRGTMKRISMHDKIKSTSPVGAARPVISSHRYFVSQLHEEPEEGMKLDYP